MFKKLLVRAVLVGAITIAATSCAASNVSQSKFQSQLVEHTKLTKVQAACVAKATWAQFDQSERNKLYTADNSSQLPAGVEAKFTKIVSDCFAKK